MLFVRFYTFFESKIGIRTSESLSFVQIYGYIALWLTNMEKPRTRTDFEDSYTMKLFCFQFINYYSSLVYIAFFKVRNNTCIKIGP